jgi:acyl-CoA synthetase (AMP-forming)/AMP-acid ligase II/acyl carrier protein
MNSHQTLVAALRFAAEHRPEQTAFILLRDGDSDVEEVTYAQLDRDARRLAVSLRRLGAPGARVLLISKHVVEHLRGIFACQYAGMIPVSGLPPYPPRRQAAARQVGRLRRFLDVMEDSAASIVVAAGHLHSAFQRAALAGGLQQLAWLDSESVSGDELAVTDIARPEPADVALLQYTSGSTSAPKGVVLSHRNIVDNIAMQVPALGCGPQSRMVTWLPPYHDLGIIGSGLTPVVLRFPCVVMTPGHFAEDPMRWLRAMSRYRGTITGAPNFAFALCAKRATEAEKLQLDLRDWKIAVNGAEPVSAQVLRNFASAFASCGFAPTSMAPMYGLAEATLAVTFTDGREAPNILRLKRKELGTGEVVRAGPGGPPTEAVELVSCGHAGLGVDLVIVDPDARTRSPAGRVGEIWCRSTAVADGYYGDEVETAARFAARLDDGDGPYLRTGDLGFMADGELYFVSRLKDLIIIRGINYSPQQIETLATECHPALEGATGVACSLNAAGDEERLFVICEVRPSAQLDLQPICEAIRRIVFAELGLEVFGVVLVKAGGVPKTPSGKLQRRQCLADYVDGDLPVLHEWRESASTQPIKLFEPGERPRSYDHLVDSFQRALGAEGQTRAEFLTRRLTELGLDSMRLLEFAFELRRQLGIRVPAAEIFELGQMEPICQRIWDALAPAPVAQDLGGRTPETVPPERYSLSRLRRLRELRET